MSKNSKTRKNAELVGEICLYGTSAIGIGWLARGKETGLLGNGEPKAERAATEAVWQAADALRAAGVDGVVAIYAPGGERYAVAHVANIPTYGSLAWRAAGPGVVISAEEIQKVAI